MNCVPDTVLDSKDTTENNNNNNKSLYSLFGDIYNKQTKKYVILNTIKFYNEKGKRMESGDK